MNRSPPASSSNRPRSIFFSPWFYVLNALSGNLTKQTRRLKKNGVLQDLTPQHFIKKTLFICVPCKECNPNTRALMIVEFLRLNFDGLVKSRHSRENGNPVITNYMKILDSCLRRNDRKSPFQTFYETINFG